jgi:hypothetical protein
MLCPENKGYCDPTTGELFFQASIIGVIEPFRDRHCHQNKCVFSGALAERLL